MAVLRACLPRLGPAGAHSVIVGSSAATPVPGSGLVSMAQAAVLMMQPVAAAEADGGGQRIFALVLGPVRTRAVPDGSPGQITADRVGEVAAAGSREIRLGSQPELALALAWLEGEPVQRAA